MKAYIHSFRGEPWNEECAAAMRGFRKLGIECVLFSSDEALDTKSPSDIVVGGMLIMGHIFSQFGITPPNYNYPKELEFCRGRKIRFTRLKDIMQEEMPFFIKPLEEKIADGIIVRSQDDLADYRHLPPETPVIYSEAVPFLSEWRCFIRYSRILGIRHYKGDCTIRCNTELIRSALAAYPNSPAGFALDFGVTEDRRTLLVEMNDGFSIGCYGLPDEQYALMLSARWFELIGQDDPFRSYPIQ